jgi:hypothetical protein
MTACVIIPDAVLRTAMPGDDGVQYEIIVYDNYRAKMISGDRMDWPVKETQWADRTARHLKAELKRANMTYDDLALKLRKHGFTETKASIANKLARATLPAHFFVASLVAMGKEDIALKDI